MTHDPATRNMEGAAVTTQLPTRVEGPHAVATTRLVKTYGRETAVDGIDLQVPEGAVYVLIGPNGAGKTTTLRILLDLTRPTAGTARVLGLDTRERGPQVRAQVGYVPERLEWGYGWMRVGRLLEHHAAFHPTWDHEYASHLARAFELRLDKPLGKLSKGQARRVQLTLALAHRPRVLVLDEPTDGLDPIMRDETLGLLMDHIAQTPTTTIISTHLVHEADRLADHVGMLRGGRLITQAPRDALRRMLRRYRADVPDGWAGVPDLNGAVAQRAGLGREIQWLVWGEEPEITARLKHAGATVRDVSAVTLEEATLALLGRKDMS
jgi:ABC-2 type transport system ATP-binding protein